MIYYKSGEIRGSPNTFYLKHAVPYSSFGLLTCLPSQTRVLSTKTITEAPKTINPLKKSLSSKQYYRKRLTKLYSQLRIR